MHASHKTAMHGFITIYAHTTLQHTFSPNTQWLLSPLNLESKSGAAFPQFLAQVPPQFLTHVFPLFWFSSSSREKVLLRV